MAVKVARIITGAGVRHSLSIYASDGTALDLTGATPRTITYKSDTGATVISAQTITLSGTPSVVPQGYVDLTASQYSTLTGINLYGQVSITLSTGKVHVEDFVQPVGPHEPYTGAMVQVSDLKEYLGIPGVGDDNLLFVCIARAQKAIERYCGVDSFASTSYTEDTDGSGTDRLCVKNPPITTLTSVSSLARQSDGTEVATAVDASSYRYDSKSGQIVLVWAGASAFPEYWGSANNGPLTFRAESPRWVEGFRNFRIVYVGGYADGSFPADLQQACLEVASTIYRNRRVNQNMAGESTSTVSYTAKQESELVAGQSTLLTPYRMQWV